VVAARVTVFYEMALSGEAVKGGNLWPGSRIQGRSGCVARSGPSCQLTKIAHCVLMPLSQVVTAVAWKFPAGAGAQVAATLGYADRPTWVLKARLATGPEAPEPVKKGMSRNESGHSD